MTIRVVSALVAIILLLGAFAIWRQNGLAVITALVGLGCIFEYSRLMFSRLEAPLHLKIVFCVFCAAVLLVTGLFESLMIPTLALSSLFFLTMTLITIRRSEELPVVLQVASVALMGFIYCGFFAGLVLRLLMLPNGSVWLLGLLAVVFAGDTFAYLSGRLFGRTKLLEPVSPKKTVEGSLGGLLGSALAGLILGLYFLPQPPLAWLVVTAFATGGFAQVGDLFESLIKRVAEVKDSGAIMPGHGGLLDRVDGVLFAAPVFFVLANYLTASQS